jgi:signal transduction histidine kinase
VKFTVDTHLFRELGELLVGRDSTALVELVKNAYDADAARVVVYGEGLDDPRSAWVQISDDGVGMSPTEFEQGFLRIASRLRERGTRLSRRYSRRFTGAKGIGRLAAHKIARLMELRSVPWDGNGRGRDALEARIDWDTIEQHETLEQVGTDAVSVTTTPVSPSSKPGTTITLRRLRKRWTSAERGRFLAEVQTFEAPAVLAAPLKRAVVEGPLLFENAVVREARRDDPGFRLKLEGEFAAGEDYWQALAESSEWVIEIDALSKRGLVRFCVAPTKKALREDPDASRRNFDVDHPDSKMGPFFQARILVRVGTLSGPSAERTWAGRSSGVRVYVEGFRVLPYGEPNNDWLGLDSAYTRRVRTLPFLEQLGTSFGEALPDEGLSVLPNSNHYGAVFLTQDNCASLRMLVNREGFIPDAAYDALLRLVRTGLDLATRVRAAAKSARDAAPEREAPISGRALQKEVTTKEAFNEAIGHARKLTARLKRLTAQGKLPPETYRLLSKTLRHFRRATELSGRLISEGAMVRILASVGTQMSAFIHEIAGLLGMAQTVDGALSSLAKDASVPRQTRHEIREVHKTVSDLRRRLERQASYLIDVVTPDARRRRIRQSLADRFEAGKRLVADAAKRRRIEIRNEVPVELTSPPMFPAELTVVFANLLTNAVKAAGEGGTIRASGERQGEKIRLLIENTGTPVNLREAERWFRPFESTTVELDPVLGQGMGLGLPITRAILQDYGATIQFVPPRRGFATAVEISFET